MSLGWTGPVVRQCEGRCRPARCKRAFAPAHGRWQDACRQQRRPCPILQHYHVLPGFNQVHSTVGLPVTVRTSMTSDGTFFISGGSGNRFMVTSAAVQFQLSPGVFAAAARAGSRIAAVQGRHSTIA